MRHFCCILNPSLSQNTSARVVPFRCWLRDEISGKFSGLRAWAEQQQCEEQKACVHRGLALRGKNRGGGKRRKRRNGEKMSDLTFCGFCAILPACFSVGMRVLHFSDSSLCVRKLRFSFELCFCVIALSPSPRKKKDLLDSTTIECSLMYLLRAMVICVL